MRNELLMGASVLALIELNSGYVEAQTPTVITVCGTGGAQQTDLRTAIRSIVDDYSKPYDVQVTCAGAYPDSGQAAWNGTLEAIVSGVTILENCPACQFYLGVGDELAPAPGAIMLVKNITIDGATTGNPPKTARCVQLVSANYVRFEGDTFENCQDGVLANRWALYAQAGYGVVVFSGNTFNNNCSSNGPSHAIYIAEGFLDVGGTMAVPGSIVSTGSLTVGQTIIPGDSVVAGGSFSATGSIVGKELIVSSVSSGTLYPGAVISGTSISANTVIITQATGGTVGGAGKYYITNSQTIGSETVTGSNPKELLITASPNHFGECNLGYNTKARTHTEAIVANNEYVQNFTVVTSAAVQAPQGGTVAVVGNTVTLGPLTGTGAATPPDAFISGGIEGFNTPATYIYADNTVVASGTTKKLTMVENLQSQALDLMFQGNTIPPTGSLIAQGIIEGLGTVGAGNVAGTIAVTPTIENTLFYFFTNLNADYRGTSGPKSATMSTDQTVWGGNGVLTAQANPPNEGYATIGGPGGLVWNAGTHDGQLWYITDANSPMDSVGVASPINFFLHGANEVLNITNNYNGQMTIFQGSSVTMNMLNQTKNPQGFIANMGGVLVYHGAASFGQNSDIAMEMWPGGTINVDGQTGHLGIDYNSATINFNSTIVPSGTGVAVPFNFQVTGGVINASATVTAGSGTLTAINGFALATFDDTPGEIATITLKDSSPQNYFIPAVGGATVYAGVDKVTLSGSGRSLGPPPVPLVYHVQSSAAGSTISSNTAAFSIYLDGHGVVTAGRLNNQNQSDYLEVDPGGSGTVTIQQPWRTIDKCGLGGGVTQTSSIVAGGTTTLGFSTGGKAVFQGTASGVVCNSVSINPSTLMFVQSTPLIASVPINGIVGVISGGCPPYTVGDTTHFKVVGGNLEAAATLSATTYSTTISDSLP